MVVAGQRVNRSWPEVFLFQAVRTTGWVMELNFQLSHRVEIDKEKGKSQATILCELYPWEEGARAPFHLLVEIVGSFTHESNGYDEQIQDLLKVNTLAILFPYLRAAVTSVTSAANVAPVVLPTINVTAMAEPKSEPER